MKEVQVQALETQAAKLRDIDPEKEQMLSSRKVEVEEKFQRLMAPLVDRRKKLDQFKRVQQVQHNNNNSNHTSISLCLLIGLISVSY